MLKLYKEHPEFDTYTKFDTNTGQLTTIDEREFIDYLPSASLLRRPAKGLMRVEHSGNVSFLGVTPSTHVRFPRRIYLQITRQCPLNCDYCFIKAKPDDAHVPTDAIYAIAREFGHNGLMEVRLTGGEPTVHPDFVDILNRFRSEGVYVSVATNGVWKKRILEVLCTTPHLWVIVSVDGDRDTHNRYRHDTFDVIMRNLKCLKRHNPSARIRLTTVLTKHNKNQMMALGRICSEVGAESITIIPLRPQVRKLEVNSEMVTADEFKYVIEDLIAAQDEYGISFTTTMETDYKKRIFRDPIVRKRSSCAAGREATNLDYDAARGEFVVYACSYSPASDLEAHPELRQPFLAGHFAPDRVEDFYRIWHDPGVWGIYRDLSIRSQSCLGCAYLKSHQCTGSCPIQNIAYDKIDVGADVLSQLKEQIRKTGEWYCYQNFD